jgi:hypothetical protein
LNKVHYHLYMPEHTGTIPDEMPPSCPECGGWNHRIERIPIFGITWKWYCRDCGLIWKTTDSGTSADVYSIPSSNVFHESKKCADSKVEPTEDKLPDVIEEKRPCENCVGRIMRKLYEHHK